MRVEPIAAALAAVFLVTGNASAGDVFTSLREIAALVESGETEGAYDEARVLAESCPELYDVQMNAGWTALLTERYEEAIAHYTAALDLSGGTTEAWYGAAGAFNGARRWEEAESAARRSLDSRDGFDDRGPRLELAFSLFGQERYEESLREYRSVADANPSDAASRAGIAWCLIRLGKDEAAATLAREALGLDPSNEPAEKALAQIEARPVVGGVFIHGILSSDVPSFDWGVGASGFVAVNGETVRGRLGYRVTHVAGLPDDTVGQPVSRRDWSAGKDGSTQAHFASAGIDLSRGWFGAGLIGGIAGTSNGDWIAGVGAARLSATFAVTISATGAVVASENQDVWQITPRLDVPAGPILTISLMSRVTELDGEWTGYGELALEMDLGRFALAGGGGYGKQDCPLFYEEASLRDYEERMTWRGYMGLSIGLFGGKRLHLEYELFGTQGEVASVEVSGLVQSLAAGVSF